MARTPGEPIDSELRQWESKLDEAAWNIAATGRVIERAAVYCDCPEGMARRDREAERRTIWLNGFTAGQETERLQQRWALSGLPPMDELYPLDRYPQESAEQKRTMKAVAQWKPPRALYLDGDMRRGKTTIAMALGLKALRLGYAVRFWTVDGLIEHLKGGIGRQEAQEDLIRFEAGFEFLILDDIGASALTEFSGRSLLMLIDQRLQAQRPTIFTSNLSITDKPEDRAQLVDALAGKDTAGIFITANRIVARIKQHADVVAVRGAALGEPAKVRPALRWT
jgi:DNA replication protein DnaC